MGNVHSSSMAHWKAHGQLLLVLIEDLLLAIMVEALSGYRSKLLCSKGVGHFKIQFQGEWGVTHKPLLASENYRVPGLSCGIVCVIPRLSVSTQYQRVTDGHTTMANAHAN